MFHVILRRFARWGIAGGSYLFLLLSLPEASFAAETWNRWEQTLTSQQRYTNPYADVTVSVTFTDPAGEAFSSFGFWDGGDTWKIRCAFPAAGNWRWRTTTSPNNPSLNQEGNVTVSAYHGNNPLYAKGFLKVGSNHRYLTYADGTPFFWVGDTPWPAGLNANDVDWQSYVNVRAGQKFNILQMALAPAWAGASDRNGNPAFLDSNGNGLPDEITQWNPGYWRGFEEKVQYANQQGLVVCLCGVMEPLHEPVHHQRLPETTLAERFARNLAARFAGNHVVFSPSFDSGHQSTGPNPYAHGLAVGNAIRSAAPRHLIVNHPQPAPSIMKQWHDSSQTYADITGMQTGHGWAWTNLCSPDQVDGSASAAFTLCQELYAYKEASKRPLINMEPRYMGPWLESYLPRLSTSCGYWSVLNGTAGVTFGIAGIWNWGTNYSTSAGMPCDDNWTWQQGRDAEIATRIKHFAEFFSSRKWWLLVPAGNLIQNQTPATNYVNKMALAKSPAGNLALAYLPDNDCIQIDMGIFPAPMKATWFDCVTGTYTVGQAHIHNQGTQSFNRPVKGEWALVLEPATAGLLPRQFYGAKLEPVNGVLHGAGQSEWEAVYRYAQTLGVAPVLYMDYVDLKSDDPHRYVQKLQERLSHFKSFSAVQLGLEMACDAQPQLHYEQDVAAGKYDDRLNTLFAGLKQLNLPFYIRIGLECNGGHNGYQPEAYKPAFVHVTRLLRASGLEAATVWCVDTGKLEDMMPYYPGDEWVDWWGLDLFSVTFIKDCGPFLKAAQAHRKPVMIGESTPCKIGVLEGQKSWDSWFQPYFDLIHSNPGVKAFCYINWNWARFAAWKDWGDARLEASPAVAELYRKEMAQELYLHGTTREAFDQAMKNERQKP